MVIYVDEVELKRRWADVPAALQRRRSAEIDRQIESLGGRITNASTGVIHLDISKTDSKAAIFQLITDVIPAAVVTVEADDILPLFRSRDLFTANLALSMRRGEIELADLLPEELFDKIAEARIRAGRVQVTDPTAFLDDNPGDVTALIRDDARDQLVEAGYLDRREQDANEAWLNQGNVRERRQREAPEIPAEFRPEAGSDPYEF